jgi:hypothetical protein
MEFDDGVKFLTEELQEVGEFIQKHLKPIYDELESERNE